MRDEGVIYVAGHPLLNRRCTRLSGCIRLRNDLYCAGWGLNILLCFSRQRVVCLSHTWTMHLLGHSTACLQADRPDHCWAMIGSLAWSTMKSHLMEFPTHFSMTSGNFVRRIETHVSAT